MRSQGSSCWGFASLYCHTSPSRLHQRGAGPTSACSLCMAGLRAVSNCDKMLRTWVIADDYISDKGLGLAQNSEAIFPRWKTKLYSGYIAINGRRSKSESRSARFRRRGQSRTLMFQGISKIKLKQKNMIVPEKVRDQAQATIDGNLIWKNHCRIWHFMRLLRREG